MKTFTGRRRRRRRHNNSAIAVALNCSFSSRNVRRPLVYTKKRKERITNGISTICCCISYHHLTTPYWRYFLFSFSFPSFIQRPPVSSKRKKDRKTNNKNISSFFYQLLHISKTRELGGMDDLEISTITAQDYAPVRWWLHFPRAASWPPPCRPFIHSLSSLCCCWNMKYTQPPVLLVDDGERILQ